MAVQRFARFQTNLGNLRISQDICYVRMIADNSDFLTIYGHRANLLNNNKGYPENLSSQSARPNNAICCFSTY